VSDKRRGLGRGLGALIPTAPVASRGDRPVDVFFPGPTEPGAGSAFGLPGSPTGARAPDSRETTDDRQERTAEGSHGAVGDDGGRTAAEPSEELGSAEQTAQQVGAEETPDELGPRIDGTNGADEARLDGSALESSANGNLVPVPGARFAELPVEAITPNPRQPRTVFDEDDMAELVHSVREIGVLQPVVVRPLRADDDGPTRYELVMGERRWRASQEAGLGTVPAIVRETGDDALLRDALLENLHRSQLNPLEEAAAYAQLLEDFGCTHDVLATRIGRSRPQISNTLRLLRLPPLVQRRVAAGVLSAGHARALLGLDDAAAIERLAQRVVAEGLSVRAVEEIVALGGDDEPTRRRRAPRAGGRSAQLEELAQRLSDRFDTRVQIALGRRKGKLSVEFASVEDLNRILELLAPGDAAVLGHGDDPQEVA
jgi:ParB family transcriptional regulator, chromosome partitioning protein